MIGSNTRDYKQRHGREPLSPQHVHVLEAGRPAGVDGHLQRPEPRDLHGPPRADQHAAAGAGDAERPAVRRGGPAPGRSARSRRAARRRRAGSTSSPSGCWPGRSGRRSWRSCEASLDDLLDALPGRTPEDAKKLIAVGESKADADARRRRPGGVDDAGERADEPGRSAEQVSRRQRCRRFDANARPTIALMHASKRD